MECLLLCLHLCKEECPISIQACFEDQSSIKYGGKMYSHGKKKGHPFIRANCITIVFSSPMTEMLTKGIHAVDPKLIPQGQVTFSQSSTIEFR